MNQAPGLRAHHQACKKERRHDGDEREEGQGEQRRVLHNEGAVLGNLAQGKTRTHSSRGHEERQHEGQANEDDDAEQALQQG